MALHQWFIPHRDTHKKAHLLSLEALAVYIVLFLALQLSFSLVNIVKPGILGVASNIQKEEIIRLTNQERAKIGLGLMSENQALDGAALAKAQNMFAENYWAHFSPSGKDPWSFMSASGYNFSFAGENLAKNFSDNQSVVTAWMNSPTHRENMVNPKYKDIGVAVLDGTLNGQRTTLVVQMFATTENLASLPNSPPTVNVAGQSHSVATQETPVNTLPVVANLGNVPAEEEILIDQFKITKSVGLGLISLMVILLAIDLIILRKRGVFRITSYHLAHMAILGVAAAALLSASPGAIL